ncbi:hypothetical protein J4558_25710 [Leptolyngbya sp. 15MV]|nr:hypothetical protein J4558_25710 [Leptolyngbya sp. 15MV]
MIGSGVAGLRAAIEMARPLRLDGDGTVLAVGDAALLRETTQHLVGPERV